MSDVWLGRNIFVFITICFLAIITLKKKQNVVLNWALFYSTLWNFLLLITINWLCVKWGLWEFKATENSAINIPYDLCFVWIVLWGVLTPYLLKGKYSLIACVLLLWLDVLIMPYLEKLGIIDLNSNWLIGEIALILVVYLPSHLWVKATLAKANIGLRSFFQFICITILFFAFIPFVLFQYIPKPAELDSQYLPYITQIAFIIGLPSLIAVVDLKEKGHGTPFPYDATNRLVRTGVYAYIRNPIQWSLTFIFIPISIYYQSIHLLGGVFIAIIYTLVIANSQEYDSLTDHFGIVWKEYSSKVPAWYFHWKPKHITQGEIYFNRTCTVCNEVADWFQKRNTINLDIKYSDEFIGSQLLQVTYKDEDGNTHKSVKAIASALEHINLAWASLAWLMRLPIVSHFLQMTVDAMGLKDEPENCQTK